MIELGIAGLGRWGRTLLESVQNRSESVTFAAAAGRSPQRIGDYARRWGLEVAPSYQALLARKDLAGVVLATPHSQHCAQILEALAAGKHVFVEKPMVLTAREARICCEAAVSAGRVLAVGFNRRFLPTAQRLMALLREGRLGRPLLIEGNFSLASGFAYTAEGWRARAEESPAGGMAGLGIHLLDLFVHLGGEVAEVSVRGHRGALPLPQLYDSVAVSLGFASGALGHLATVMATAPLWSLRVMGTEGWAELRGQDRLLWSLRKEEGERQELIAPGSPERAEIEAFAAALSGGAPYPVTFEEAQHGVAVFEAISRALESGRTERP